MTDPVALASLLKDYGPWGLLALSLIALYTVVQWLRGCMDARIKDAERFATISERQLSFNADLTENMKMFRENQQEIIKLVASNERGIVSQSAAILDKLNDQKGTIEKALDLLGKLDRRRAA